MASSTLYFDVPSNQKPIVYHKNYNVTFLGLEKFHFFDTLKWGHVYEFLKVANVIDDDTVVTPKEADKNELLFVHKKKYLSSLKWSMNLALIAEAPLCFVPNMFLQTHFLKPMRLQTGGSILAGKLATERGWAINIGGGFHHCSSDKGMGFCVYADITLLIENLFRANLVGKVMILDLDAHQGNGYQHDFLGNSKVFIMDMYNSRIFPKDHQAKRAIHTKVELHPHTEDKEYLDLLNHHFHKSLDKFRPEIVVYNAGTDVLKGDPLGNMDITPEGVILRDEFVFQTCKTRDIPIVMLTSGGYSKKSARVIADSIINLRDKGIVNYF